MSFFIKIFALGVVGLFVLIALLYIVVGFERVWSVMAGKPSSEIIQIATIKKTTKPNQYLVCPNDFCGETSDRVSPVFDVSVDRLKAIMADIERNDDNFSKVNSGDGDRRQKYIMRSPFWRFPNLISIEYIPLENNQSTIAIYAQAQLGQSDLGANKAFIDQLLSEISSQI